MRSPAERKPPAHHQIEAGRGDRRAQPVHAADPLVAEHRAHDRDDHRRGRQHERAVGDAGAGKAADEEELVEDVTDDAKAGQAEPVVTGQRSRGAEDRRGVGLRRPGTARRRPQPGRAHDEQKGRRGDRHAHGVERLRVELARGALDDREVRAPDDGHQEQQAVERAETGGIGQGFRGFRVQRVQGSWFKGSRFEVQGSRLNP